MLYGIVYVYRLSDFLDIAEGHGVERVFLHSLWLKGKADQQVDGYFKWTDLHEISFMGAFGMGYKMIVQGLTKEGIAADNHFLWTESGLISTHVNAELRRRKTKGKQLMVTFGALDSRETYRLVRIPWTLFMENRMPVEASVHDATY